MQDVDVTIVGGGPVGIFAAYYARLRDLNVRVVESLATLGGQISALYPQKQILDVAGFPNIAGDALVQQLKAQADQLAPEVVLGTVVEDVQALADGGFQVITSAGSFKSGAVIIATGVVTLHRGPYHCPMLVLAWPPICTILLVMASNLSISAS